MGEYCGLVSFDLISHHSIVQGNKRSRRGVVFQFQKRNGYIQVPFFLTRLPHLPLFSVYTITIFLFLFLFLFSTLTSHDRRSGNLIRTSIPLWISLLIIDTHEDTRIALSICAGETHRLARLASAGADVDLRTAHVELNTAGLRSRVQCNDFGAQEVLARCDARGHGEVDPAARADHAVDTPRAGGHVEAVFVDFEPFLRGGRGGGGVVDFGPGGGC
jgi:hypothetical protein